MMKFLEVSFIVLSLYRMLKSGDDSYNLETVKQVNPCHVLVIKCPHYDIVYCAIKLLF